MNTLVQFLKNVGHYPPTTIEYMIFFNGMNSPCTQNSNFFTDPEKMWQRFPHVFLTAVWFEIETESDGNPIIFSANAMEIP